MNIIARPRLNVKPRLPGTTHQRDVRRRRIDSYVPLAICASAAIVLLITVTLALCGAIIF